MATTQELLAYTLQKMMQEQYPAMDWSAGTVLFELLIKPASDQFATQYANILTVRNNMSLSLALAQATPDPTIVDALLSNYNIVRKSGSAATGLLNVYTASEFNVQIPAGAVFTCNGVQLQPTKSYVGVAGDIIEEDTTEIAYVQMRDVGDGTWVFSITASTVEAMETVLSPGLVCSSDLSSTRISRVETGSTFTGGSVEETTTELLERAQTQVNSSVVTGRDNIRALLRKQEDINVLDAQVFGMGDSLQLRDAVNNAGVSSGGRLDVYVKTAPVPIQAVATLAGLKGSSGNWTVSIPSGTYPGAAGVTQIKYGNYVINTGITPILDYEAQGPWPLLELTIHARYSKYQLLSVEFAFDEVPGTSADFQVTILYFPGIGDLQDYLDGVGIRSHVFDHVVKSAIPLLLEVDVELEYESGVVAPTAGEVKQQIADVINRKLIGVEAFYTSDIVYACRYIFPEATVRMPINLRARAFLPDGSQAYTSSQSYIKVAAITGMSYRNCVFCCFPTDVNVTLNEIS